MNNTAIWLGGWAASWLLLAGLASTSAADLAAAIAGGMAITATFISGPKAFANIQKLLGVKQ